MIKFLITIVFAIITLIPSMYTWGTYKWSIADDDKLNSDTVYKIENISISSIETKLNWVEKINIEDYK